MKVYKFGGASVKDVNAVRNLYSLIKDENSELIVVVSAMGKTTNRLEHIWEKCISQKKKNAIHELDKLSLFHSEIINNLNLSQDEKLDVKLKSYVNELKEIIKNYKNENMHLYMIKLYPLESFFLPQLFLIFYIKTVRTTHG